MIDGMCGWLFVVGEGNAIGVVVVVVVVREGGCYCERSGWAKKGLGGATNYVKRRNDEIRRNS